MITLVTAVAGAVGAIARYSIDALWPTRGRIPWSTLVINLTGSLLIGIIVGAGIVPPAWNAVLTIGLLGGYTTFSTAVVHAAELLLAGERNAGIAYAAGTLAASAGAAISGLVAGQAGATWLVG